MGQSTSWQIEGRKYKLWQILFSWTPESLHTVAAAIKLEDTFHWKESYDKHRQCIKKQKQYFADKDCIVSAVAFPVVMERRESWTIKKTEHGKTDVFKLRCWKRLLSLPWTPRRSNKSIWKEINPEYSLEGLMLKLELRYFVHLMQRAKSLEKTLMLRKTECRRRRGVKRWDG